MRKLTHLCFVLFFALLTTVGAQSENAARIAPPMIIVRIDDTELRISPWKDTTYEHFLPYTYEGTPTIKVTTEHAPEPVVTTSGAIKEPGSVMTLAVALDYPVSSKVLDQAPVVKKFRFTVEIKKLPELDLFLCIGQSNMAGRGPMDESKGDLEPIPDVYLFTADGNWETAANPLNKYSNVRKDMRMQQIGPVYAFAQTLAETKKAPIGLVVNALGGSSIEQWLKDNTKEPILYVETMKRAREAQKWGRYRAILWHQGESNVGRSGKYPEQIKQLVSDLRRDLGDDGIDFVAGELAHWRKNSKGEAANGPFNAMLRELRGSMDRFDVVSAADLQPIRGDRKDPHFDREGQLILGRRYAESVLKNVYAAPEAK